MGPSGQDRKALPPFTGQSCLPCMPGTRNLTPRTHEKVEAENKLHSYSLTSTHVSWHIYINNNKNSNNKNKESFGDIAHGESVCLVCSRSLIQSPRNTGYLTMNTEDGLCVLHFNPHIKWCIPFLLTHIHAPSSTTVHVLALLNACATQHSKGSLQCALISVFSPCPRLIPTSLWSLRITYGSRKALWDWKGQSLSFWDRLAHPILPSMSDVCIAAL